MKKNYEIILFAFALILGFSKLSYGQTILDNFLETLNASSQISGRVYLDTNGNGTQDAGEPGLQGVTMLIINSNNTGQFATTNADGDWTITVIPGLTQVFAATNSLPPGVIQTQGTNPTILSVPDQANIPNPVPVDVGNFGFFFVGNLQGNLYLDVNGNGTQDVDEPGIADVEIFLTDQFGNTQTVLTNEDGLWEFQIGAGEVVSDINQNDPNFPTGAFQTEGTDPTTTIVGAGETVFSENDGFFEAGIINGTLYLDSNGNGTQDAEEPGIADVEIVIETSLNTIITTTTDANGNWSVMTAIGNTVVNIDEDQDNFPTGAEQTEGTNPTTYDIEIGQSYTQVDGFYESGNLNGRIYLDENANGTQDPGEPGIEGVAVEILKSTGDTEIVFSNVDGDWTLEVPVGETTSTIDTTSPNFPIIFFQTEGTNPTTSNILTNETVSEIDGFAEAAEISGTVYEDLNANASQDAGEPGFANIEITITDEFGNIQIVTTDADGNWSAVVLAGNVTISIDENQPNFPQNAISTEGQNPNIIDALAGETYTANNGYFILTDDIGELNAHLYFDENGNGTQDAEEPDMPNVEVEIIDANGDISLVETDTNGDFSVIVPAGNLTYTINEADPDFPTGAIQTEGTNPTTLTVLGNQTNFGGNNGFFDFSDSEDDGAVTGLVYLDQNGNGTQDAGEPGINNIEVSLQLANGNAISVFTDMNGSFSALVPEGSVLISINEDDPNFPDGAIQTEGVNPNTVIVNAGATTNSGFYGYFVTDENITTTVLTHLYVDENGNGTQDAGEPDLANIDVIFTDTFGNTQTVATDANGDAEANVPVGNIDVLINEDDPDFPAGAIQTEGINPSSVLALAGQFNFAGNNGFFVPDDENGDDQTILSAHLYLDQNGNGTQDAGEPDLANVAVEVIDVNGNTQNLTTNANGDISAVVAVGNLTYTIDEDDPNMPENAIQTEGTNPTTLTALANQNNFGGNNGFFVPSSDITTNLVLNIYLDENGNGTQDTDEPDLPNVNVTFTDALGNVSQITTDANGFINTNIPAGQVTYLIDEDDPNMPEDAIQTEGTNPTTLIALTGTENQGGSNGFFVPGGNGGGNQTILSAHLYLDENGNGTQDPSEPDLANVAVEVADVNGNTQNLTTNANGDISTVVAVGNLTYTIDEDDPNMPENAIQTEGTNPTTLTALANQNNFGGNNGFFVPSSDITTNLVLNIYLDENGNGTQDTDEPDLQNVNVTFTDALGNVSQITTDANGFINTNIPAGQVTYLIDEDDPNMPEDAIQTEGTNPTTLIALSGIENQGGSNGFFVPGGNGGGNQTILSAHLYLDENGNGTQDPSEPDLANVAVEVVDINGNTQNLTTNANGDISTVVAVGNLTYTIDEDDPNMPENAIQTEGTNPTTLTAVANQNNFGGNNGFFVPSSDITTNLVLNIYLDENGNGTQDTDEPDLPNVSVSFTDALGDISQITTDANGFINTSIPAGQVTYLIDEDDPNMPEDAIQTEGTNPTTLIALSGIENQGGSNGFFVPGGNGGGNQTIFSTHVYLDENGNGTQDAGEPDLPNIDISIIEASGNEIILTTDVNGNITTQVEAGELTYTIDEDSDGFPEGAIQTEGTNPTTITAEAGQNNFGGDNGYFVPQPTGETGFIITHLYFDSNGNGNQDAGEPNMVDVEVFVTDQNETISLFSDGNGNIITQVAAGQVTIEINELDPDFPTGAIQTEGTNPTTITLNPGTTFYVGDNGFFIPEDEDITSLFGHLYLDQNANGTQDANEPDLVNVNVIITDSDGNEQTITTNPNGDFVANVAAGELIYLIDEDDPDFPEGAVQTEGTNPTTLEAIEGESNFGGNNGFFILTGNIDALVFGHLYKDLNGNGTQDEEEPNLVNIEVEIIDQTGTIYTLFTDNNGDFETELASGFALISINEDDPDFPTGAIQTEGSNPMSILLPVDQETDAGNFGFHLEENGGGENGDEEDEDGLEIFNAVSPNGDGRNEFFRIEGLSNFPNNNVKIYDRSGVKVFDRNSYGFNGNVFRGISEGRISVQKNKRLPTGTYFYLLEYQNEDGERKRKQGYLYLN